MKKILLLSLFALCARTLKAQTTQIDSNEIKTISRNSTIIQQQLHGLHLDALLRDKLDSVYNQSMGILSGKYTAIRGEANKNKVVKPTVKKP
jgi:S-ribosylhomocysteine lyase LuxS involved in autoinducer biosynthesis